jgi:nitrilase
MVKGGSEWNRLISATQNAGIYTGLSFAEKLDDNLFMVLTLISPTGAELISHHKLRPSGAERNIFSDGTTDQLTVITSTYGKDGFPICGEY